MIRADFYLLPQPAKQTQLLYACRVIEKAYLSHQSLYIHTSSSAAAQQLDELLWLYRDDSFVPHAMAREAFASQSPITIGYEPELATTLLNKPIDILLLLGDELPNFFLNFNRLIEIIPNIPAVKEQARQHYRLLQQHTTDIHTHTINVTH